ncbi:MAG: alpha/beta fold hydrolase [Bryobacteraceae bacterium]
MKWYLLLLMAVPLAAQDVPVVLLNGYQVPCTSGLTSSQTFGSMEQLLSAAGRKVLFFDNCTVKGAGARPTIEELGQALGAFLAKIGSPEVDVVAHSMGGLIVRCYLSGKLPGGGFSPPDTPRIRKAVFIATPHWGALAIAGVLGAQDPDVQLREQLQGSQFLWDLGTWNQGTDDLREVDAISVVGSGGNSEPVSQAHDGAVPVASAAFAAVLSEQRVRVLPYCHQAPLPSFLCQGPALAQVDSASHLGYRIVLSFLQGTPEWKSIGMSPGQLPSLSKYGGLVINDRDAQNRLGGATRVFVSTAGVSGELPWNSTWGFFADLLPAGQYRLQISANSGAQNYSAQVKAGQYLPILVKPGPAISAVLPAAGVVATLYRAPGMLIAIFGTEFDGSTVEINGMAVPVLYNSSTQINSRIPENLTGLVRIRVNGAKGIAETQVLLEQAVPAVFSQDSTGTGRSLAYHLDGTLVTGAALAHPGEAIAILLTGLGSASSTPSVTIGAQPATILARTQLASLPGVDRLDVLIPVGVSPGDQILVVCSGKRVSNETVLPIGTPPD